MPTVERSCLWLPKYPSHASDSRSYLGRVASSLVAVVTASFVVAQKLAVRNIVRPRARKDGSPKLSHPPPRCLACFPAVARRRWHLTSLCIVSRLIFACLILVIQQANVFFAFPVFIPSVYRPSRLISSRFLPLQSLALILYALVLILQKTSHTSRRSPPEIMERERGCLIIA
jgi:hypothetical protein